ncbi:hypothetical protein [uncultured Williamsia sp.]|uniref:hypothetical protein n=1 Tax=uncultured Williamsia sp. TaxID=259311 RepID=UPI0026347C1C|nr:hypothetical protein [uncultured Williamsia sp.]
MSPTAAALVLVVVTVVAAVAFVAHRRSDARRLEDQAALVERLRSLAGQDPVHRAAVDEFEVRIYQRLFSAGTVGPRLVAAAWAGVGTVLGASGVVVAAQGDGLGSLVLLVLCGVTTAVFGALTAVHLVRALYAVTTLPRVTVDDLPAEPGED